MKQNKNLNRSITCLIRTKTGRASGRNGGAGSWGAVSSHTLAVKAGGSTQALVLRHLLGTTVSYAVHQALVLEFQFHG